MAELAIIDQCGFVVNRVVVADNVDWSPDDGFIAVADQGYVIGGSLIGGVYTPLNSDSGVQLPPLTPLLISDRQFFQQLALDGVISEVEAEAAVATGAIPAEMLALIEALPEMQRFGTRMMLKGTTVFERRHPLTMAIGMLYGWTEEQMDQFFQNAAAL